MALPEPQAWLEFGNERLELAPGSSWRIGRSAESNLVVDAGSVSRQHALVQRLESGEYCIIDLGSRNGSLVNGKRVATPVTLRDGDRVTLGEVEMTFRQSQAPRPATPRSMERTTSVLVHACEVTILAVDIRDFTPFTRQVREDVLAQTIGTWFRTVGAIVQKHGSTAEKYVGDAVMAVWVHHEEARMRNEVYAVLRAMLEIARATATLCESFPLPFPLRVGAGVNTGHAIVGGTDYTALGDTVNAAFRFEAATRLLAVDAALGQSTVDALEISPAQARQLERHQMRLKGYDEPVMLWVASFEGIDRLLAL